MKLLCADRLMSCSPFLHENGLLNAEERLKGIAKVLLLLCSCRARRHPYCLGILHNIQVHQATAEAADKDER